MKERPNMSSFNNKISVFKTSDLPAVDKKQNKKALKTLKQIMKLKSK